jgi:hypothetical protein
MLLLGYKLIAHRSLLPCHPDLRQRDFALLVRSLWCSGGR